MKTRDLNNKEQKSVNYFVHIMRAKLEENTHKRHWSYLKVSTLLKKLKLEIIELEHELINQDSPKVARECADIANYAMMIADKIKIY